MLSLLIPSEALRSVLLRLSKIARTAGTSVTQLPGTTTLIDDKRVLVCSRVTVGELPSVAGYSFVARLEHLKDGNVVVRLPAEPELPEYWRTARAICDHCGKIRMRKETFLLRATEGKTIQIGRNCLADFLGEDASRFVAMAELVKELDDASSDESWNGYVGHWEVSPVAFIACAVSSIESSGFRKSDEEGSTKEDATFLCGKKPSAFRAREAWLKGQPTEAHVARAEAIVRWIAADHASPSEYLWNLRLAITEPGVGKHAALLASAPVAMARAEESAIKYKRSLAAQRPQAGFAGPVGAVFEGKATLLRFAEVRGFRGASKRICTFRSEAGFELVWFATGLAPARRGDLYQLKGKIKRHDTHQGVSQTVLTRVQFELVKEEEPAEDVG